MVIEAVIAITVFLMGTATLASVLFHQSRVTRCTYQRDLVVHVLESEMLRFQSGAWSEVPIGKEVKLNVSGLERSMPRGELSVLLSSTADLRHAVKIVLKWRPAEDSLLSEETLTGYAFREVADD
jgi:hypothetical protein